MLSKRKDLLIVSNRIKPVTPETETFRCTVEFLNEKGIPIGVTHLVLAKSQKHDLMGIAFKRAAPHCLAAASLRFFYS